MTIYFYDGSFEGYLTTIFKIYECKKEPTAIKDEKDSSGELGEYIFIDTEKKLAQRVKKGIVEKLGGDIFYKLKLLYLSEVKDYEMIGLKFLQTVFKNPIAISSLEKKEIREFFQITKKVSTEKHRMLGFIRFEEVQDGFLFAKITPDYNQLPLIGNYFAKRLGKEKFIIFDTKRSLGLLGENGALSLKKATIDAPIEISLDESVIQEYWQLFFQKVAIKERRNTSVQNAKVPKRYQGMILEFKEI